MLSITTTPLQELFILGRLKTACMGSRTKGLTMHSPACQLDLHEPDINTNIITKAIDNAPSCGPFPDAYLYAFLKIPVGEAMIPSWGSKKPRC